MTIVFNIYYEDNKTLYDNSNQYGNFSKKKGTLKKSTIFQNFRKIVTEMKNFTGKFKMRLELVEKVINKLDEGLGENTQSKTRRKKKENIEEGKRHTHKL